VLGAGVTHDGGATWEPTLGFLNYQDNDITFDPADPNTSGSGRWAGRTRARTGAGTGR